MYANSEGPGETARMRRLAWAFAGRLYDEYHELATITQKHTHSQMKHPLTIGSEEIAQMSQLMS